MRTSALKWAWHAVTWTLALGLAFLWGAGFLYVIPSITESRFSKAISIGLGIFGLLPPLVTVAALPINWMRGTRPIDASTRCTHCGQPIPDRT